MLQFQVPLGITAEQASRDRFECELAARGAVPEATRSYMVAPPAAPPSGPPDGFMQGLARTMPGIIAAARMRQAFEEQQRLLTLCMMSRGYMLSKQKQEAS